MMNLELISNISYEDIDNKINTLKEYVYDNIKKPFNGDEDQLIEATFKELMNCFKLKKNTETRDYFEPILNEVYENDDFLENYNKFDESRDNNETFFIQNKLLKDTIQSIIEAIMLEASYSV